MNEESSSPTSGGRILPRRHFLGAASMAAFGAGIGRGAESTPKSSSDRPNILLIMSDEHRAAITGCYGNRIVRTPNLDELASQGIVFDNCYTNSPLCVPSRLSMTSGKYSSRVHVWGNSCWLPSNDYPSIARVIAAQGYESVLCGKMHFDATRNYGFTQIGPLDKAFKDGREKRFSCDDATINQKEWQDREITFKAGDVSGIMNHDRAVRSAAVNFLSQRRSSVKPFFLIAGFVAPHYPLTVPAEYLDHYRGRIAPPFLPLGHTEMQPLNYQQLRYKFGLVDLDPSSVIRGRECYYGFTEWLDQNIGEVLKALRSNAALENTVVVYSTDHGENMGEHGLWWKNCMYETATHIPLIISWPSRFQSGVRREQVCSLLDVVQTIVSLTGATPPADWNGNSLLPVIENSAADWKNFAISEYYAHYISSGFVMLRQGSYKYVYHTKPCPESPPQRELYNLDRDPDEFINIASHPEQQDRISSMHALLVKELGEDPEVTEQHCRAEIAVGYKR